MPKLGIPWFPQDKQKELLHACGLLGPIYNQAPEPPLCRLIGYGGAAFGGKSDGLLGIATVAAFAYPGCRIGFFRRKFTELEGADGAIERSHEILNQVAEYNAGRHRWTFPTGSRLFFCHCHEETNKYDYQSQAFDILLFDEATHFPWSIIDYLLTRNRPSSGAPVGMVPLAAMATNPGNVGHAWFYQLFDPMGEGGPVGEVKEAFTPNEQYERTWFLPAFLEDNKIGIEKDPEYEQRLEKRDPDVARALRWGDWTVFAGQAFRQWRKVAPDGREWHVITPFDIPGHFPRWRAIDYGFVHPFSALWFAKDPDIGRVYVYRNVNASGVTDRQQARVVIENTPTDEHIPITYASPDMWAKKNMGDIVTTTYEEYLKEGVVLTRADNDRLSGKRKIDRLLMPLPDGLPGLQVFNTCVHLIRTMPLLIRSEVKPEDVEKAPGDDDYDCLRYGLTNTRIGTGRRKEKRTPAPLQRFANI